MSVQRLLISIPFHRVVAVKILTRTAIGCGESALSERLILSMECSPSRIISPEAARNPTGLSGVTPEAVFYPAIPDLLHRLRQPFRRVRIGEFQAAAHLEPFDDLLEIGSWKYCRNTIWTDCRIRSRATFSAPFNSPSYSSSTFPVMADG
jgi:hypothetical protein